MSHGPSSIKARVWFNKCFSSVEGVLLQLRADWPDGLYLIGSHTDLRFPPLAYCDLAEIEPTSITADAYVNWCLQFCENHKVDVFIPGRMRDVIADHRAAFESIGSRLVVAAAGDFSHKCRQVCQSTVFIESKHGMSSPLLRLPSEQQAEWFVSNLQPERLALDFIS
jgi:hypothetical protein